MTGDRVTAWGAELRRVHARLREALALARASLDGDPGGTDPAFHDLAPTDLLTYCIGFCAALDGHHRSEDGVLFPEVAKARPELAPVISKLSQDHSMIGYLIGEMQHALKVGAPTAEALRHLDGIEAVMESHFRYEERELVGVLNAIDDDELDSNRLFGAIA